MSFFHRALLYVVRKRVRSLLLLLICLGVGTLALSGSAIREATQTAQLNVRQALGGVFTLQQNTSDPDQWVTNDVESYGSTAYYGGTPLTEELAARIQEQVPGIKGYNATYTNYTVPVDASGETLTLLDTESSESGLDSLLAGYGDFSSSVATYASANTRFDSYFAGGYLELVAGRHLTEADTNSALLSQDLAQANGLTLGDTITLRMSNHKASMLGYDPDDTCVEVEIVGLFQSTSKSTAAFSNWSMDNSIFTTLEVVKTARPDMGTESYEKITFYVEDPGQLEFITAQVEALPELSDGDFLVTTDNSSVEAVTAPLQNMNRLVSLLILLAVVVGGIVLYLVLASRVRERMGESGILLSLGFSKGNILAQHLTEALLLAVLAFSLSVPVSGLVAEAAGNQLLDSTLAAPSVSQAPTASGDGVSLAQSDQYAPQFETQTGLTEIVVTVSPAAIACLFGVGTAILCVAVSLAALPILHRKPREIAAALC